MQHFLVMQLASVVGEVDEHNVTGSKTPARLTSHTTMQGLTSHHCRAVRSASLQESPQEGVVFVAT